MRPAQPVPDGLGCVLVPPMPSEEEAMTFTWWLVPIVVLGVGLIVAPAVGAWWARDWRPTHCERCRRELVGSPPVHMLADRMWCRQIALHRIAAGERP